MEAKSSGSTCQTEIDLTGNSKKTKSHKPIILLRRNSSGVIASKDVSSNASLPRLKSMRNIKILPSLNVKAENKGCSSFPCESDQNKTNRENNLNFLNKTENLQPTPVKLKKQIKEEVAVKQQNMLKSLPTNAKLQSTSVFFEKISPSATCPVSMVQQNTVLQTNFIGMQQQMNGQMFSQPQHYQSVQVNNPPLNSLLSISNEQFQLQPSHHCNHCFYPTIVQTPDVPMQFAIPESGQMLYQPNSAHGVVSEGAIVQTYSNSMLQVQNNYLQFGNSCNIKNHHSPLQQCGTEATTDDSLTNITWLGKMGMNNFMPVPLQTERKQEMQALVLPLFLFVSWGPWCQNGAHLEAICRHESNRRPPYSYMALIQFAINSSITGKMTLRQIYQWIEEKFPYFKTAKPGWKNSIRHNLSLHDLFVREVTTGSKASYWTLRPDLNMRPLTLDSVGTAPSTAWSLQSSGQEQKPILPQLPYCSQPYVLLPVPLLQNSKESPTAKVDLTDMQCQESSSSLLDSGCDGSHCTPSSSSKTFSNFSDSSLILPNDSGVSLSRSEKKAGGPFPLLSQASCKSGKRSRKEPLRTLNDSLNSSLHFVKEELNPSPSQSFPSSNEKTIFKKIPKLKEDPIKPVNVGLTEESFSQLLNDLGSPFKTYLNQESLGIGKVSPKLESARKRRRSWGSPEASGSGLEFQQKLRAANEKTPVRHQMRRVKSDLVDLTQAIKNEEGLPTSTPLNKEKWKKIVKQRKLNVDPEDKENMTPKKLQAELDENWRGTGGSLNSASFPVPPSPIRIIPDDSDIESDFFKEIIGSVFKTPDKPSPPIRHFDSLSPHRPPLASVTGYSNSGPLKEFGECSKNITPMLPTFSPAKDEPLNTSFSKLLDISGGSGGFGRFTDIDLNLSWTNFPNM